MQKYIAPRLEHVLGDTWCIVTGFARIPIYMPERSNAVMIDSGVEKTDRAGLLTLLEQENIRVSAILTSHFHFDHIGNHAAIKEKHGAEIYMTYFAALLGRNPLYQTAVTYESMMTAILRGGPFDNPADHMFSANDDSVTAAGYTFKILPLPGHAQEHVGFVTPDGVAYLGDTILSQQVLRGIRVPYLTCCREDLEAKASVLEMNYPCYILAHNGICTSGIRELAQENIDSLQDKLQMIESLCDQYVTMERLTAEMIQSRSGDGNSLLRVIGAKRNMQTLVEYLQETGRLDIRARDGYVEYIRSTK